MHYPEHKVMTRSERKARRLSTIAKTADRGGSKKGTVPRARKYASRAQRAHVRRMRRWARMARRNPRLFSLFDALYDSGKPGRRKKVRAEPRAYSRR